MAECILFISGGELIMVMLLALLFFGSKAIPDIAKTLGKGMREFKKAANEIQRELEANTSDVRKDIEEIKSSVTKDVDSLTSTVKTESDNISKEIKAGILEEAFYSHYIYHDDVYAIYSSFLMTPKLFNAFLDFVAVELSIDLQINRDAYCR